jgi:hypothetical protein
METAMAWKAKTGREADRLARIAALLFALAGLAERAAVRSLPVRWIVLWCLALADAVARDFVARSVPNAMNGFRAPVLIQAHYGSGPADALNLAASLNDLAHIVRVVAARLRRMAFLRQGADPDEAHHANGHGGCRSGREDQTFALRMPERCDTS